MQSPTRKSKAASTLRSVHIDQLSKLQTKHQQECDLLEDIRNFSNQRAKIEKNYGEALLKLSTSLLQRKIPSIPEVKSEDGKERMCVYSVWRMVLDENEKLAKARLAAAEVFQQQISESAKHIRAQKLQVTKKCLEQLQKIHEEIQLGVRELDKTKKAYGDEEHVAHEARDKAHDAEEKLKRKKGNFFQSLTSLQKNSAKFLSKKEVCDIRSTGARNEYLLTLAATNAHQTRYHEIDLPELMRTMDAEVYEKVADYFQLLSQTELFTCAATHSSFTKVKEYADLITRQYNLQCYLNDWTGLRDRINYSFEPCDDDKIDFVSSEHNSGLNLNKEGKRWAVKIAKENKAIREYSRQLRALLHQSATGQRDEAGGDQSTGVQDLEQKIEETKQNIRKCETNKLKAEARLELLKEAGVNAEEWLSCGDSDMLGIDLSGGSLSRAGSTLSVKTDISGNVDDANEFYDSDFNDDVPDVVGASAKSAAAYRDGDSSSEVTAGETSSLGAGGVYMGETTVSVTTSGGVGGEPGDTTSLGFTPMRCLALYNYTAQNADELSIIEQEVLEIVGEGDGDGWVKARNSQGTEGFVPEAYVEVESGEMIPSSIYPAPTSFSSVDYSVPDWGDGGDPTAAGFDPDSFPPPPPQLPDASEIPVVAIENHVDEIDENNGREAFCRAVYDYEATCPEELTFVEGQVIRIISKHVHDVDDGWWEGTVDGQIGIFPCLVVEELRSDGEPHTPEEDEEQDLTSPPGSAPPTFAPPPMPQFLSAPAQVIITQATPEVEHAGRHDNDDHADNDGGESTFIVATSADDDDEAAASAGDDHADQAQSSGPSYSYTTPDFDMELPDAQQTHYQAQFSTTDNNANEMVTESRQEDGLQEDQTFSSSPAEFPDVIAAAVIENIPGLDVDVPDEGVDMGSVECSPPPIEPADGGDDIDDGGNFEPLEINVTIGATSVPKDGHSDMSVAADAQETVVEEMMSPSHHVEVVTGEAKVLDDEDDGGDHPALPPMPPPPEHTG